MRFPRDVILARQSLRVHWLPIITGVFGALVLSLLIYSQGAEEKRIIFKREGPLDFKNASILGNPGQTVLRGEEHLFSKQQKTILDTQNQLKSEVESLRQEMKTLNKGGGASTTPTLGLQPTGVPNPDNQAEVNNNSSIPPTATNPEPPIQLGPPTEEYFQTQLKDQRPFPQPGSRSTPSRPHVGDTLGFSRIQKSIRHGRSGAAIISFPVKTTGASHLKKPSITLPSGSYVKATLLTGVEAPEGKSYPALLQLDYAYIIPNHKRLDLAGCFIIAKAQGDLSTERVQMQATKLSCVSRRGGMFEREVNGFVADDADNSFAVMGSVNAKQDRVAATAFLSGIVAGIGKAIQQAQTTSQTTPLGGSQNVLTGDQGKYIAAGGASEAATMVTQWYLKQAQNLLPTINIGSGQDVWVIMQDQVDLPKDYFMQNLDGGVAHASIYSHFTRLVD